jgi:hypothetical protein
MNTTSRRISLGLLTAGLMLTGVTACGGQDGSAAPKSASTKDFCKIVKDLDLSDPKSFVDGLVKTGTPKGIPADARAGFEVMIEKATEDKISDGDQKKVNAFVAYFTKTCAGA